MRIMDKYRRRVRLVFLGTFILLCLQYAYAILIEEPYPSIVMPAFARANIINNQTAYTAFAFSEPGSDTSYTVSEIFPGFSQAGARILLNHAFFSAGAPPEALDRKDQLVIRVFGRSFYDRVMAPLKPDQARPDRDYSEFAQWICRQMARVSTGGQPASVEIAKVRFTQDMIQKTIIQQDTLGQHVLFCDPTR